MNKIEESGDLARICIIGYGWTDWFDTKVARVIHTQLDKICNELDGTIGDLV